MDEILFTKKEQKILQCLYCGNQTLMDLAGQYKHSLDEFEYVYYGYFIYKMFLCPICGKITFHRTYWDCTQKDHDGNDYLDEEILYPINSLESDWLPETIKKAFESALKVKNIDNEVCFLALRRTLELVLVDKGAMKWGLQDKIEELAKKNILPDTLKEASLIAKLFGDTAAHKQSTNASVHDINTIVDFIEYILEYFYIIPSRLDAIKQKLMKESD